MPRRRSEATADQPSLAREGFTDRARQALDAAVAEARRLGHNYIGTEHFLLGLTAVEDGVAARALVDCDVTLERVRESVENVIGRGDGRPDGPLSVTPRAKRVLELATEEARALGHGYVGTEHVLLGLLTEGEGIAAGILDGLGITREGIRDRIVLIVGTPLEPSADTGPLAGLRAKVAGFIRKDNVVACRVGIGELAAIDLLVEAGIRSTRSDAAAWLIRAGIEANRPLFARLDDTARQIRRLRQEAQSIAREIAEPRESPAEPPGSDAAPRDETTTI